jgi:hypothetical protein
MEINSQMEGERTFSQDMLDFSENCSIKEFIQQSLEFSQCLNLLSSGFRESKGKILVTAKKLIPGCISLLSNLSNFFSQNITGQC